MQQHGHLGQNLHNFKNYSLLTRKKTTHKIPLKLARKSAKQKMDRARNKSIWLLKDGKKVGTLEV